MPAITEALKQDLAAMNPSGCQHISLEKVHRKYTTQCVKLQTQDFSDYEPVNDVHCISEGLRHYRHHL